MPKTLQEMREERAGCVQLRSARSTGTVVGVYDAEPAGLDASGDRWYTICEDHGMLVSHPSLTLARHHAPAPEEWCEVCQSIAAGNGLPGWYAETL